MEVNRTKFIYLFIFFLCSFFVSRVTNDFRFLFVRGEQVQALKSSSLRGNFLLSTALFVSVEVLIRDRAKPALS